MTLDELKAAVDNLNDEQKELLYLDLSFQMRKPDSEIIRAHSSAIEQRWSDFVSGKTSPLSFDEAINTIKNIPDA